MKKVFNDASAPDHISLSLLGGLVAVAFTNSLPWALATIFAVHACSSAYTIYKRYKLSRPDVHVG
jgi:hypothetical protein